MKLIIHGNIQIDTPDFDAARWVKRGSYYNIELLQDGEVVMTYHDITEESRGSYKLDTGEIPYPVDRNEFWDGYIAGLMGN